MIAETSPLAEPSAAAGFEVGHVSEDGTPQRLPLSDSWAVRFEHVLPVRRFASRTGSGTLSGLWCHELVADLSVPLHDHTLVRAAGGER